MFLRAKPLAKSSIRVRLTILYYVLSIICIQFHRVYIRHGHSAEILSIKNGYGSHVSHLEFPVKISEILLSSLKSILTARESHDSIRHLHEEMDDDEDGNVNLEESDEYLREELQYKEGDKIKLDAFHQDDGEDEEVSLRELWNSWRRSKVYTWTKAETLDWFVNVVGLSQYTNSFRNLGLSGPSIPKLASNYGNLIEKRLGIHNPAHIQRITQKAKEIVLFGPRSKSESDSEIFRNYFAMVLVFVLLSSFGYMRYRQATETYQFNMRLKQNEIEIVQKKLHNLQRQTELNRLRKEKEILEIEECSKKTHMLQNYEDNLKEVQIQNKELQTSLKNAHVCLIRSYEIGSHYLMKKIAEVQKLWEKAQRKIKKNKKLNPVRALFSGPSLAKQDKCIYAAQEAFYSLREESHCFSSHWDNIENCLNITFGNLPKDYKAEIDLLTQIAASSPLNTLTLSQN